ncbi:crystal Strucure of A cold adapted subtilisin-like serine proteinase, partial [Thamnocephalis sphaerospora]
NWGLERIWQRNTTMVNSDAYVYPASGGANVHIYVVDSGVDVTHPDFGNRAKFDVNYVAGEGDEDMDGHGTHVAGIAAGSNYGVVKNAYIHAVKVLDSDGVGYVSDVVRGLLYVAHNRPGRSSPGSNPIRVVNLSLHTSQSDFLNDAVSYAYDSGVVVVSAAGNTAADACDTSPASSGRTLSVGATEKDDRLASFSAFGRCVDILAPGVSITSTWNDGGTQTLSGTSMASPFVTGVVALYLSEKQYTTPQQVMHDLLNRATLLRPDAAHPDTPNRLLYS